MHKKISFVFFGSSDISVQVLEHLKKRNLLPSLIVTSLDKPKGRGLEVVPSVAKTWAEQNSIPVLTPAKLKDIEFLNALKKEIENGAKAFVLVSYGRIIPQEVLDIPPQGILNLHPSLLPLLRGPSPIESLILNDMKDEVGISIMRLDAEMDHGPIIAQEKISLSEWPITKEKLTAIYAQKGSELLAKALEKADEDKLPLTEQDHTKATYTKKFTKEDTLIDLENDPYKNYLKILAFGTNPAPYFFIDQGNKKIRVKIISADFVDGRLLIKRVVPEGKKQMDFESFKRGLN